MKKHIFKVLKYTIFYGILIFIFSFLGNFLGTYADTTAENMALTSAEGNLMMMERYVQSLYVVPKICYVFSAIFAVVLLLKIGYYFWKVYEDSENSKY